MNGGGTGQLKPKSLLREYAEAILVAVLITLFVRGFVAQAFRIPSGSMLPTLQVGDQLLVDKIVYRFHPPKRGDIIVFKYPEDESRDFIKRIIGMPGETLEVRERKVFINGAPLNDSAWAHHDGAEGFRMPVRDDFGPVTVPPGHYFMMGDNRENSQDSRFWGFLAREKIIGRAFIIYWSRDLRRIFPLDIRFERLGRLID